VRLVGLESLSPRLFMNIKNVINGFRVPPRYQFCCGLVLNSKVDYMSS
jgi:hypothetical protein